MIGYRVYQPSKNYSFALNRLDSLVFVRDGFAWLAVLSPLLWALYHRLWIVAFFVVTALLLVTAVVSLFELSQIYKIIMILLFNFAFGIEANAIRSWYLEQQGFREAGFVTGNNYTECQRRFFENWLEKENKSV